MACRIGISTTPRDRIDHWKRVEGHVQPHEICPFGQYSCGLRLGEHYCGFRSARPQLAVFQDMSVSPLGSPALVSGFRWLSAAAVLAKWEPTVIPRWREESGDASLRRPSGSSRR